MVKSGYFGVTFECPVCSFLIDGKKETYVKCPKCNFATGRLIETLGARYIINENKKVGIKISVIDARKEYLLKVKKYKKDSKIDLPEHYGYETISFECPTCKKNNVLTWCNDKDSFCEVCKTEFKL